MGAEHMVQYGDIIDMNLLIENVGTMHTNGITVTVSSNDEYITMLDEESIIAYAMESIHPPLGPLDPLDV